MPDLTSCYFCGTTAGPLTEHPVVPTGLDPPPQDQRIVVVCPSCRQKLLIIQELIVDVVGTDQAAPTSDHELDSGAPDDDPMPPTEPVSTTESESSPPSTDDPTATETSSDETQLKDSEHDAPPPEARRIHKLLQNRDLPVDRADIEAIATSAYEMDSAQCHEAIDALIEAGVLIEQAGQLDRPNEDH